MTTAEPLNVIGDSVRANVDLLDEVRSSAPSTIAPSKRILDVLVATGLIVLSSPLLIAVALLVRRDGGPALFVQRRVGQGGRIIEIRKFRSMAVDAEARLLTDGALHRRYVANGFKIPATEDPRLSRWGAFLRSSSIDELPQLFSVLRGDMSMVGPRPIVEPELSEYARRGAAAAYLSSRPGLTGLWQVSGRSGVKYDRRVALDVRYLDERSLFGDIKIIVRTALVVIRRVGAH